MQLAIILGVVCSTIIISFHIILQNTSYDQVVKFSAVSNSRSRPTVEDSPDYDYPCIVLQAEQDK